MVSNKPRVQRFFRQILMPGIFGFVMVPGILFAGTTWASRFGHESTVVQLAFEVASIKPHQSDGVLNASLIACHGIDSLPDSIGVMRFEGAAVIDVFAAEQSRTPGLGRCILSNISLKGLIDWAYGLDLVPVNLDAKVEGGPDWAATERFDIEAKAENTSTTTANQLKQMVQYLLSERFGLKFHRETREALGFALLVAGGEPKLQESTGAERRDSASRDREGTMIWNARNLAAPDITRSLWRYLGRPVVDQTQLGGTYDFTLTWKDDALGASVSPTGASASGPSLVTALKEQLGLRIESQTVPVEIVVIDFAKKPGNQD
jgi:uncharacterized protein (TIGR03435 family)